MPDPLAAANSQGALAVECEWAHTEGMLAHPPQGAVPHLGAPKPGGCAWGRCGLFVVPKRRIKPRFGSENRGCSFQRVGRKCVTGRCLGVHHHSATIGRAREGRQRR